MMEDIPIYQMKEMTAQERMEEIIRRDPTVRFFQDVHKRRFVQYKCFLCKKEYKSRIWKALPRCSYGPVCRRCWRYKIKTVVF